MKFRKKPVIVEAVQLRWDNWSEMCDFAGVGKLTDGKPEVVQSESSDGFIRMAIPTPEGLMLAKQTDWIVKGVNGELYPVKEEIFLKTYKQMNLSIAGRLQILDSLLYRTIVDRKGNQKRVRNKINGRVIISLRDAIRALDMK
jgi:hypothetical protein